MGLYHFMRVSDPFAEDSTEALEAEATNFVRAPRDLPRDLDLRRDLRRGLDLRRDLPRGARAARCPCHAAGLG